MRGARRKAVVAIGASRFLSFLLCWRAHRAFACRMLSVAAHGGPITCLLFIERLDLVWSCSEDGTVHAWKVPSKRAKPKKVYSVKGFSGTVTAAVDACAYVVLGYESGALVAWDASQKDANLAATH